MYMGITLQSRGTVLSEKVFHAAHFRLVGIHINNPMAKNLINTEEMKIVKKANTYQFFQIKEDSTCLQQCPF